MSDKNSNIEILVNQIVQGSSYNKYIRNIESTLRQAYNSGYLAGRNDEKAHAKAEIIDRKYDPAEPIHIVKVRFRSDTSGHYDVAHWFLTPVRLAKGEHVTMQVKDSVRHGIVDENSFYTTLGYAINELGAKYPLKHILGVYASFKVEE